MSFGQLWCSVLSTTPGRTAPKSTPTPYSLADATEPNTPMQEPLRVVVFICTATHLSSCLGCEACSNLRTRIAVHDFKAVWNTVSASDRLRDLDRIRPRPECASGSARWRGGSRGTTRGGRGICFRKFRIEVSLEYGAVEKAVCHLVVAGNSRGRHYDLVDKNLLNIWLQQACREAYN